MTLGQHLCTDQHVDLAATEVKQNLFKTLPACCRVAINASDTKRREAFFQELFQFLCTFPNVIDVLLATCWTCTRRPLGVIAVVTKHYTVGAVIRQSYITVWTLNRFAARTTQHET